MPPGLFLVLFPVLAVDGEGDGAVVDEGDFHVCAELAGFHRLAKLAFQCGDELFVQRDSDLRLGGAGEGGAVAFLGAGVKGELADHQHAAADLGERAVHQAIVVVKDAQPGDLAAEPLDVLGGVGVLNAEKHDEALANAATHLAADGDGGFARSLDDCPHDWRDTIQMTVTVRGSSDWLNGLLRRRQAQSVRVQNFFSGGAGTVCRSVASLMRDTPSNDDTNPQPFDIEAVSDLRGLRLFLDRYERDILRPIELPAVLSAYWFANRGQFRELLELDAELSANASLMPFAEASLSVGREHLRLLKPMYDQRMVQRFRKCVVAGEARGWNPVVFGIFLSIHSVPVREGLVQFGTQLWNGFVNGAQKSCRLPDGECTELLGEYLDRLPGWIEEVVTHSMGEEGACLAAVS